VTFQLLLKSLFGETEEKHSDSESRQTVTVTRLELGTSIISQGIWLGCHGTVRSESRCALIKVAVSDVHEP
jgi:hypothetical protein